MLEGRFGNTSGAPYLESRVSIPRLSLKGLVSFLVDTGADGTVFMPADSKKLGVNFGTLKNSVTSEGIGGAAKGFTEQVVLSFSDRRFIYTYLLNIEFSAPTKHNHRFPSLLGRDIIDQWRFCFGPSPWPRRFHATQVGPSPKDLIQ
jgi:hypothetical protein